MTSPFSDERERLTGEEVWLASGEKFAKGEPFTCDLDVCENGRGDGFAEALFGLVGFGRVSDDVMIMSSEVTETLDEVAVDAGADSKREDVGSCRFIFDEVEDGAFSCDVSVRDQDEGARAVVIVRKGEGLIEGVEETSAAIAAGVFEKVDRFGNVG